MKNIVVFLFLGILTINVLDALGQQNQKEKPNIIFIMTDDQSPMPVDEVKSSQSRPFGFNGDGYSQ